MSKFNFALTTEQTIPADSLTKIQYDLALVDPDSQFFNNGFLCKTPGDYHVSVQAYIEAASSTDFSYVEFVHKVAATNAEIYYRAQGIGNQAASPFCFSGSGRISLALDDTLHVRLMASGSSVELKSEATYTNYRLQSFNGFLV